MEYNTIKTEGQSLRTNPRRMIQMATVKKAPTRGNTRAAASKAASTAKKAPAKAKITEVKNLSAESAGKTDPITATPATKGEKKIEFKKCGCGCGNNIGPKSNYAMGHDARHASATADLAVRLMIDGEDPEAVIANLPTDALRHKARNIADNRHAKLVAKMEREAAKAEAKSSK